MSAFRRITAVTRARPRGLAPDANVMPHVQMLKRILPDRPSRC